MRYVIDGYNLLHAWGLAPRHPGQLERARRKLLDLLCEADGDVTVVFDAARAPAGVTPEQDYKGIHVRFILEGTADDWIENLIRRESRPQQLTIVSDDRRLRKAAERHRCRWLGCLDYIEEVQGGQAAPPGPAAPSEEPAKSEKLTEDEARRWLEAFGGADDA
jgi:predicted RNA-binding protein with PIN domain